MDITKLWPITWYSMLLLTIANIWHGTNGSAVSLISNNIDSILTSHELVIVNFYADWCYFSQQLKPVFDETAIQVKQLFPTYGQVTLGKVDCDRETAIAQTYNVNKYPMLKIFIGGKMAKGEYRGQRSVEALVTFVQNQLRDSIHRVYMMSELNSMLDMKKSNVIGYFDIEQGEDFNNYNKVSKLLRDDCEFYAVIGEASKQERLNDVKHTYANKLVFKPQSADESDIQYPDESDIQYPGSMKDYNYLTQWMHDQCIPIVRVITFQNAEELTEEDLPFVILFHHPGALSEKVPNVLSRCHTKRRTDTQGRPHPSFGMTPTF